MGLRVKGDLRHSGDSDRSPSVSRDCSALLSEPVESQSIELHRSPHSSMAKSPNLNETGGFLLVT
ncbi:MAG: hypothetical protein BJG00_017280 [Limnothrix sp. CACIAM 69d]|nr:MAG: hypothetical protein BJG00_017280 [Limnothrix sp. CACIAM 69d]